MKPSCYQVDDSRLFHPETLLVPKCFTEVSSLSIGLIEVGLVQERRAEALRQGGLVTYKDQISYGLHVIVVMGVFYLIGHLVASRISSKASMVSNHHTFS